MLTWYVQLTRCYRLNITRIAETVWAEYSHAQHSSVIEKHDVIYQTRSTQLITVQRHQIEPRLYTDNKHRKFGRLDACGS